MSPNTLKIPDPSWLDRTIAWISPQRGFERSRFRAALALAGYRRGIEAISTNRLRSEWPNVITAADAANTDREKVRSIVRNLLLNNPYAAGALSRIVANVVGRGIRPQCRLRADTTDTEPYRKPPGWRPISEPEARRFQTQSEDLWAEFVDSCDIGQRLDFYEMEALVERQLIDDGEVLVYFPRNDRRRRGSGSVSFGIELIEADRLGTPPQKMTEKNIHDGVEVDPMTGAPVAYWIRGTHPAAGDVLGTWRRIERFTQAGQPQILHLYHHRRPDQYRGLSAYTPALGIFQDLHRYWEAEIVSARVAACYAAFVKSPVAFQIQQSAGDANDNSQRVQKMEPGMIWYGAPGEEVSFGDPKRPNSQFGIFTEILLRAIGVCLDLPFELIALDFSKTNYSSARASLLEGRRTFQRRQAFLIGRFGKPTWRAVVREGIVSGRLDAPGFAARQNDYLDSFWTPPSWGWVDPVKEETAARESIHNYLSTHADELAAQGRDFDQTVEQISREHKRLKELDLPSPWDAIVKPTAGAKAAAKEIENALAE